jgi:acyl-CoA thioester hydrolase
MYEYRTRRRIEFSDTDLSGLTHFARYFVFMESAEHELLRSLGAGPGSFSDEAGRRIGWPRVAASCEYLAPCHFGDEVDIRVRVVRQGRTSLTYELDLARGETPVARGRITAVCCELDGPAGPRPIPIPEALAARLSEAPAEKPKPGAELPLAPHAT